MAVAVARSPSDGDTMRYLLPVLRMTLRFHITGPMGRIRYSGTELAVPMFDLLV